MNDVVHGRDVVIEKKVAEIFYIVGCATSCTFNFVNQIIGKTTPNSGLFPRKRVRMSDCSGSISGVTKTTNADKLGVFHFLLEGVRRIEGDYRFTFTDDNGTSVVLTMTALVETISITSPVSDFSEWDLSITATGGFSMSELPEPTGEGFVIMSDWWETVADQSFVEVGIVASGENGYLMESTDEVLEIDREGVQHDVVAGLPGNRQARYNSSLERVEVQSTSPFNAGERIFVLWKRDL